MVPKLLIAALLSAGATALVSPALGSSMHVLYSFCAQSDCTDGANTEDGNPLVMDQAGNLYGTTNAGGTQHQGVIFELSPGKNGQYGYNVLYNFCSQTACADGSWTAGSLIIDTSGNLYGVNRFGGNSNDGDVFELVPSAETWTYNVIYSFCSYCADASVPFAGLTYSGAASGTLYDGTSPLFGTTIYGGDSLVVCEFGCGTVYELQPGKISWSEQVIYSFCSQQDCSDGSYPEAPVTVDGAGNIYGTTDEGGSQNGGVGFELNKSGTWNESVLRNFCSGRKCTDGAEALSGMAMNSAGDLVGFTEVGGIRNKLRHLPCRGEGCGVVYSLSPARHEESDTVLYRFCAFASCMDGGMPTSNLSPSAPVLDTEDNIFGAASVGGKRLKCGTLFELSGSTLQVLYDFAKKKATGCSPVHGVYRDQSGRLYGMTLAYGANGRGTIFRYDP